ncbi:unnamed protein product [Protopolystoma xenopodis]|uniref:Uncharacterized protein n=1 Tax=Protopolystoma xenopodis TaxID=117903 RepID=A0A3S4ZFK0_9PLAT|nr:unnamed protein product [Protopolystoma xenopodis]
MYSSPHCSPDLLHHRCFSLMDELKGFRMSGAHQCNDVNVSLYRSARTPNVCASGQFYPVTMSTRHHKTHSATTLDVQISSN